MYEVVSHIQFNDLKNIINLKKPRDKFMFLKIEK